MTAGTTRPFVDTKDLLRSIGVGGEVPRAVVELLERATGIRRLSRLCTSVGITRANDDVATQIGDLFAAAGIRYTVSGHADDEALARGPLIFYGNHPFGIADALIGLRLALAHRRDIKVLANNVLGALDINRDRLIWIDPFDGESRSAANRRGLRETLRHLDGGGSLLMFPAGACSHLQLRRARVDDPPWSPHLARLVAKTRAAVVPIYFEGRNSCTFQVAGVIHPMLRTVLLLREFLGLSGRTLRVVRGPCRRVPAQPGGGTEGSVTVDELRAAVYALGRAA